MATFKPESGCELFDKFTWAVGIECSVLPHIKVDQFEWTQHDAFWRRDFQMIKEVLGPVAIRYGLPWNRIEAKPGSFDWGWADERIAYITGELKLPVLLDIMHFGTPQWLGLAVGDPEFPEALERFTCEIVSRYRDRIHVFCPFNEPLITALFSGDFGFWPPYSRRWRGYMPVLSRVVQAVVRSTRAIRKLAPDAAVLLCDSCEYHHTKDAALVPETTLRNLRRFAVLDLITGRVDNRHPLHKWYTSYGFADPDLEWLRANRCAPDILGLDYYNHTETEIEAFKNVKRQHKPANPIGLYGCARQYHERYGIPLMVTETSIDGPDINREIWLEQTVADCRRLRAEGVPLAGYTWWPCFDNIDWDGALLHHIGKVHGVGLFNLRRQKDGVLKRVPSPLAGAFASLVARGEEAVGLQARVGHPEFWAAGEDSMGAIPADSVEVTLSMQPKSTAADAGVAPQPSGSAPSPLAEAALPLSEVTPVQDAGAKAECAEKPWGLLVFSHLRWGFVWQRPQQLISRFSRKHPVLFVEEPMFDLSQSAPRMLLHRVMPNVVVACPHFSKELGTHATGVRAEIERLVRQSMHEMNAQGQFDSPVLYYYNPLDASWSMGKFNERAIVYDCMDELSQFQGAPKELVENERLLLTTADVVFTGGYQMYLKKVQHNTNCHFFGCGVDAPHFAQARSEDTIVPADVDFMGRPILGWFGVIDERVDYPLVERLAESHPEWSVAMIGPVVKVDPNLLPHRPNLHWLGARDYHILPNYCKAFDICVMPFAINSATQYINPTKVLEYLATGRPVVSTAIADVMRNFSSVVHVAENHDAFVSACEDAIENPVSERIDKGLELAKNSGWGPITEQMLGLIEDAIARRTGARSTAVSPRSRIATDSGTLEIAWSYPAVPGS